MGQEYSSLNIEERTQLGLLVSQKLSKRQIAAQMGPLGLDHQPGAGAQWTHNGAIWLLGLSRQPVNAGYRPRPACASWSTRFDTPLGKFVRHELQRALSREQIAGGGSSVCTLKT
ncbi:MAG: hypothetical protein IPG57_04105 [Burkholderiales bacterium]|nr:hypothetical protein [Burkholderiales bacterium]